MGTIARTNSFKQENISVVIIKLDHDCQNTPHNSTQGKNSQSIDYSFDCSGLIRNIDSHIEEMGNSEMTGAKKFIDKESQ